MEIISKKFSYLRWYSSAERSEFNTGDLLIDWKNLYKKFFGFDTDFTGLKIPEKKDGFDRLIIVAKGASPDCVYKACRKLFRCFRYTEDFDGTTRGWNDREANNTYAIWARDNPEADKQNSNISARVLKKRGGTYITLAERMLYEMKYFLETGEHMDTKGTYTMCLGSRRSNGDIPYVYRNPTMYVMYINWYHSTGRCSDIRAREVVC